MQRQSRFKYFLFQVITIALLKSRRERLKEELDSDFEHTSSKEGRNRVISSSIYRSLQDLSRVQYLHPVSFSLLMILVFVATLRTGSISLLGIVVFQVIFSRGGKPFTRPGYLYELFFQLALLVVLGNILLGIVYGIGTNSSKLTFVSFILFGLILISFLAYIISSIKEPEPQSSKPQICAKLLHMSMICLFIFELTVGKNLISQTQLVFYGTLGWLVILGLGVQRKSNTSTVRRNS